MRTNGLDHLVRDQLRLFGEIGDDLAIPPDDRRRILLLSAAEWAAWSGLRPGILPPTPMPSLMLRRLGAANHRLVAMAERRAERRQDGSDAWDTSIAGPVFMTPFATAQGSASRP